MTAKHFIAIAAILAGELACAQSADNGANLERKPQSNRVRGTILSLADYFLSVNERFDRKRFYLACGLTGDGYLA